MPLTISLPSEQATHRLGARLAAIARPGDILTLTGDLGMGKTTLARGFIQTLTGADDVPSPTFTLLQTYDGEAATIWHFDLYRLKSPDEIWELGMEDALAGGILLIEWPDRMGSFLPPSRLDIGLTVGLSPESRIAHLTPLGTVWQDRLSGDFGE